MKKKLTDEQVVLRFWKQIEVKLDGCWVWSGYIDRVTGYGVFRQRGAHRWAYENFKGSIPPKYEVDHLCRVRSCVNPGHLEAVSHGENMRRSFHSRGLLKLDGKTFDPIDEVRDPRVRMRMLLKRAQRTAEDTGASLLMRLERGV